LRRGNPHPRCGAQRGIFALGPQSQLDFADPRSRHRRGAQTRHENRRGGSAPGRHRCAGGCAAAGTAGRRWRAGAGVDRRADRRKALRRGFRAPVVYDAPSGAFDHTPVRPALFGARAVRLSGGQTISCRPAFAALAELARAYRAENSAAITGVAAAKAKEAARLLAAHRPVSMYMHNGVGQHTNATQTSRAIATFYALLGDIERQGGNVVFPKAPANGVAGKEFLPKEMAEQRIGRERKPLGPPARPGNCAAYDIFTAILEGRPYAVKALLNFGSNTVMNTGDSERAQRAFRALDFAVAAELFMTPTAALCDYVLPAASFLEKSNLAMAAFGHRREGKLHVQYRPAVVEPLGERRSDTWIIFELAKRLGLGENFWHGDIEAAYEHELAP